MYAVEILVGTKGGQVCVKVPRAEEGGQRAKMELDVAYGRNPENASSSSSFPRLLLYLLLPTLHYSYFCFLPRSFLLLSLFPTFRLFLAAFLHFAIYFLSHSPWPLLLLLFVCYFRVSAPVHRCSSLVVVVLLFSGAALSFLFSFSFLSRSFLLCGIFFSSCARSSS